MSGIDLAAICKRHGIVTHPIPATEGPQWCAHAGPDYADAPTEADAACALLKARWAMRTVRDEERQTLPWIALPPWEQDHGCIGRTELAAVVALANRLATTAPEAGC